jgi:hypothetical protein
MRVNKMWEKIIKTPYREITQERVSPATPRKYINVEGETYDKIYSGAKKGDVPSTYWTHDPTTALWYAIKGDTLAPTNRSGIPIIFEADVTEEIIDVYKDPETVSGLIDLDNKVRNYRIIEGPELAQFMEDNYLDGYYVGLHPEEYDRTIDILRSGDERAMEYFFGPRITDVGQTMRTKDYKKRAHEQYRRAGKVRTKDEVEKSWVNVIKSDDLHKDFKFRQGKSWKVKFVEWVLTKLNRVTGLKLDKEDVLRFPGLYDPKTKEATAFLDGIENVRRLNLKYGGETGGAYTQVITEILTHEYVHKVLMEDPQIMEELKPYKKHIFDRGSVSAQEWATALMSTTDELRGLQYLAVHQDVDPSVKQKAIQKIQDIQNKKQQVEAEVKTFLQENPVEEV